MFDVLMYLFETYIHSDADVMVEQNELTDELSRAGFDKDEIEKALKKYYGVGAETLEEIDGEIRAILFQLLLDRDRGATR